MTTAVSTVVPQDGEAPRSFNVGGVMMARPFRLRRLSHFGLNLEDVGRCLPFYTDLLGLIVSDEIELAGRFADPAEAAAFPFTRGVFLRHGTEHHSVVLFPKRVLNALAGGPPMSPSFGLNQMAWQVGSLQEVGDSIAWLRHVNVDLLRIGRDQPGGNWHVYSFDPDRHVSEMFYGLEQIGWDRRSKPLSVYSRSLDEPALPIAGEGAELSAALAGGVSLADGHRHRIETDGSHDVDGVRLARPFKIVGVGPMRVFVREVEASLRYYRDVLGLQVTETVEYAGHRCAFLRANTEHHALALYPEALREMLGVRHAGTVLSAGLRVANYAQLRSALSWFQERGVPVSELPAELSPGIDCSVLVHDPEGNALQLYYTMEQIGWEGRPRPASMRRPVTRPWPETVEEQPDTYLGETFLGPWN